jgi:hypothetical protein
MSMIREQFKKMESKIDERKTEYETKTNDVITKLKENMKPAQNLRETIAQIKESASNLEIFLLYWQFKWTEVVDESKSRMTIEIQVLKHDDDCKSENYKNNVLSKHCHSHHKYNVQSKHGHSHHKNNVLSNSVY